MSTTEPRIYQIVRFYFDKGSRVTRKGLTLTEAKAHCARKDTSSHSNGPGAWFDGFDVMPAFRTQEGGK